MASHSSVLAWRSMEMQNQPQERLSTGQLPQRERLMGSSLSWREGPREVAEMIPCCWWVVVPLMGARLGVYCPGSMGVSS